MHTHAERGHDQNTARIQQDRVQPEWTRSVPGCMPTQSVGTIINDGACTGLFPAKAGPTKSRPRTPCRTGFSREAVDLLLICF
ncbi:hypothetical protein SAMN05216197_12246 [Pseudomonas graminis]|uniref:Uncharacterized protein n=1 Tax=Pseudomonas graminis TaxID=158627 RepID=A0A1I0GPH8_9PSED|nr:hypothetical protein SAMN05216197_12246 [Pseudomonas graminis]